MSLLTKLQDDMKLAMKAGQRDRLTVIRMLISDVKIIDLDPKKPTEEEVVAAYAKKLKKSAEEYEKLGKPQEVDKLKAELAIVEEYLPKKASPEQTEELIDAFLVGKSFTEKQIGQAMGQFLKLHGKQVDGVVVNPIIKSRLAGK